MIRVSSLSGGYGGRMIVEDVSFTAGKGEFVGILGPNGSGKTTLMKLLTGILSPSKGEVLVAGRPSADTSRGNLRKSWPFCRSIRSKLLHLPLRKQCPSADTRIKKDSSDRWINMTKTLSGKRWK